MPVDKMHLFYRQTFIAHASCTGAGRLYNEIFLCSGEVAGGVRKSGAIQKDILEH